MVVCLLFLRHQAFLCCFFQGNPQTRRTCRDWRCFGVWKRKLYPSVWSISLCASVSIRRCWSSAYCKRCETSMYFFRLLFPMLRHTHLWTYLYIYIYFICQHWWTLFIGRSSMVALAGVFLAVFLLRVVASCSQHFLMSPHWSLHQEHRNVYES